MIPNYVTLAQSAGQRAAVAGAATPTRATATPVPAFTSNVGYRPPPAALPERSDIPTTRQAAPGEYFGLFRPCGCGHSSAWHSGSFGDAWRAGEQVRGACEAAEDVTSASCPCVSFQEAGCPSAQ